MSKRKKDKIDTSGGDDLFGSMAFEGLNITTPLREGPNVQAPGLSTPAKPKTKGGRLDVKREKSGRGGKTVTVIYAFPGMDDRMRKAILSLLKKKLATGGTISNGNIEIQGDFPDKIVSELIAAGYRAVRAGG